MATTASTAARTARRNGLDRSVDIPLIRKQLGKALDRTARTARRGANATDKYVHRHPWMAVGVAAGTMALAGLALAAAVRRPRTVRAQLAEGLDELSSAVSSQLQKLRR